MVAKLYSADVLSTAKPVAPTEPTEVKPPKIKKPATEKQLAALAKAKEARRLKKEAMEAAKLLADKQATEAAEKEVLEATQKEEKLRARREAAKERRRLKKLAEMQEEKTLLKDPAPQLPIPPPTLPQQPITPDSSVTEEPKKKKPRVKRDPNDPPQWFTKFVENGKQELNLQAAEKKPKKIVREEAQHEAQQQWQDGFTRDRINHEINNHVNRMYSM